MNMLDPIRKFINEEKLYGWMLVFIIGFTAILIGSEALLSSSVSKDVELTVMMDQTQELLKEKVPSNREEIEAAIAKADPLIITYLVFTSLGTLAIAAGFVLTVVFIGSIVTKRELIKPTVEPTLARWEVGDAFKVAIIFYFAGYLIKIFQAILTAAGVLPKELSGNLLMVVNTTLLDLFCLFLIVYFVNVKYGQRLKSIGLTMKNWLKGIFQGIAGYVTILPAFCLILFVLSWFCSQIGYKPPPHPLIGAFLVEQHIWVIVYSIVLAVVIGPVVEEIFFRGFVYSAMKKRMGRNKALLVSSAIFALLHMSLFSFLPMMFLGVVLGYLYEKTGSLIPSITLHILHNFILICLVLLVRGIIS